MCPICLTHINYGYGKRVPVSEMSPVPQSHQLFESDQKTELPGNKKKSEVLKEAVAAFCRFCIDFLVKSLAISTQVSVGAGTEICKRPLLSPLG